MKWHEILGVVGSIFSIVGIGVSGFIIFIVKRLREQKIELLTGYFYESNAENGSSLYEIGMRGIKTNNSGVVVRLDNLTDKDLLVVDIEAIDVFQNVMFEPVRIEAASSAEIQLSNTDAQKFIDYCCVKYEKLEDYYKYNFNISVILASDKGHIKTNVKLEISFIPRIMDILCLDEKVPYFYDWQNDNGKEFLSYWKNKISNPCQSNKFNRKGN